MATKTYVTTFNPSAPTGIRSGVFWSMIPATSGPLKYPALVPAQGSTPPDAVPMDPALVFPTFGVEAAASTNGNANDQAVRFTGVSLSQPPIVRPVLNSLIGIKFRMITPV